MFTFCDVMYETKHKNVNKLLKVRSKYDLSNPNVNCYSFFAQEDTEVTVVWASLTSSHPDRLSMLKHNKKGILSGKHNLIKMSTMESGGGTPPIPTMESGGGTPPIPTKPSAGVLIGPYFASCILLACLSVHLMSF